MTAEFTHRPHQNSNTNFIEAYKPCAISLMQLNKDTQEREIKLLLKCRITLTIWIGLKLSKDSTFQVQAKNAGKIAFYFFFDVFFFPFAFPPPIWCCLSSAFEAAAIPPGWLNCGDNTLAISGRPTLSFPCSSLFKFSSQTWSLWIPGLYMV